MLRDALSKKRWGGGGLLLLLLLAVLLVAPLLRHAGASHPLSANLRTDLCPLIPDPPAPLSKAATRPVGPNAGAAICEFLVDDQQYALNVTMISTRQASSPEPVTTRRLFDNWVKEAAASSGSEMIDFPGDWAQGKRYRDRQRHIVLIEDNGIMLSLDTRVLDGDQLADYARAVVRALRAAPTSS